MMEVELLSVHCPSVITVRFELRLVRIIIDAVGLAAGILNHFIYDAS